MAKGFLGKMKWVEGGRGGRGRKTDADLDTNEQHQLGTTAKRMSKTAVPSTVRLIGGSSVDSRMQCIFQGSVRGKVGDREGRYYDIVEKWGQSRISCRII